MVNNDNFISPEDNIVGNKEMCKHYHREQISYVQRIKEKRPKEEFVDMELSSLITSRFTTPLGGEPVKMERIRYCEVKKSDLIPVSNSECQCLKCRQKFPIEKIRQMEQRFQRLNELADRNIKYACMVDLKFLGLSQGIEPIWYYRKPDGSMEAFRKETNPHNWEIRRRKDFFLMTW